MINKKYHGQTFLQRYQLREDTKKLSRHIVLGYGVSTIILVTSLVKYYLCLDVWDNLWFTGIILGLTGFLFTITIPWVWGNLDKGLQKFGNFVGHFIFANVLLTIIYYSFFFPVGLLIKQFHGTAPFYEWTGQNTELKFEGWINKSIHSIGPPGSGPNTSKISFFQILSFFVSNGHFFFIPVLVILISLGIALFFLQTSVIAPFIYTLF